MSKCCDFLEKTVAAGLILEHDFERDEERIKLFSLTSPTNPENEDESIVIYYCPFCGSQAGNALEFRSLIEAE